MSDYGIVVDTSTVRFERLLPGPIERIWTYLTESEKRGKWLATGDMELRVGGAVTLTFHHSQLAPANEATPERFKKYEGASFQSRITRLEPPRLLAFTWGGEKDESEVTFELTPRGKDVLLVLTHRRLADGKAMLSVSGGWHIHLDVLADRLADRAPRAFWSTLDKVEKIYEQRISG